MNAALVREAGTLGPQRQDDAEDADGERHPQREEARAPGATAGQLRRERENGRGHEDRVAVARAHERREREAGEREARVGPPPPGDGGAASTL